MGGDAGNCSFASWAPTVPANPVPVGYDLDDLASLLTTDYFPADPKIGLKQTALRSALRLFLQTNGSVPESYCADASNTNGIPDHTVSVFHGLGSVPTFVQVQNTMAIDRSFSTFFPMEWAYDPDHTNNFLSLQASEQTVDISSTGGHDIAGNFDSTTQQWRTSTTGYWSVAAMNRRADVGSNWTMVSTSNTDREVILAQGFSVNNITLVQVQFAESVDPTVAYPLVWRWGDQHTGNTNPVSITMTNSELTLQMRPGNVFARWDDHNGWASFSSGYFRANLFSIKPDFDSGWRASPAPTSPVLFSMAHSLDTVPQIVQVCS